MVPVSKQEKDYVVGKYPTAHIVRLRKSDSKRHHYLLAEDPPLMKALDEFRKNVNLKK